MGYDLESWLRWRGGVSGLKVGDMQAGSVNRLHAPAFQVSGKFTVKKLDFFF